MGTSFLSPRVVGFAVPIVAVMLAARGARWSRRVAFAAVTLGGLILVDAVANVTGLRALLDAVDNFQTAPALSVLGIAYSIVPIVYSASALMLFVGRRPSMLWEHTLRDA